MNGLRIKTVTGIELAIYGPVQYNEKYNVYYCAEASWPAEIVTEVLS